MAETGATLVHRSDALHRCGFDITACSRRGDETEDVVLVASFSINNSFEWEDESSAGLGTIGSSSTQPAGAARTGGRFCLALAQTLVWNEPTRWLFGLFVATCGVMAGPVRAQTARAVAE